MVMRLINPNLPRDAPVVFLQHGLFCDATFWVLDKEKSVAFQLANAGFDVWMGNNRGSIYSRANVNIDPSKNPSEFFDYSFFELGQYDAVSQIDLVRQLTGKDKISYVGHSQGTTQMFAALSYNFGGLQNKLNYFAALAPIVNLKNTTNEFMGAGASQWWIIFKTS